MKQLLVTFAVLLFTNTITARKILKKVNKTSSAEKNRQHYGLKTINNGTLYS